MNSKRIGGGIVAFVGLALASDWIVRAGDALLSLIYVDGVVAWGALRSAVGLLALPIGLYFLFRPVDKSGRELELERLAAAIHSVRTDLAAYKGEARRSIYGELASIYINLERLRIATPSLMTPDLETAYKQADTFLIGIGPLVRDGHLKDARQQAPGLIAAIGAQPSRTKSWWHVLG